MFKDKSQQSEVEEFIRGEGDEKAVGWNFYTGFLEFKMPETNAHGQTGFETTLILMNTILAACYIPGTTLFASGLRSANAACTLFDLLVLIL